VFGLEALVYNSNKDYIWLSRLHRFIIAFAIVISEAFFVCNQINVVKPTYIGLEDLIPSTPTKKMLLTK